MNYVDVEYVNLVSSRLERFAKKKENLYNFRCPYCGDSQRQKSKARGYFYLRKSDILFKCHNCGVGRSMGNFLKDHAVDLHDQYVMDRYKKGLTGKGRNVANPTFEFPKPVFEHRPEGIVPMSDLDPEHPARKYLEGRQLPLKGLYYAENYKKWVNSQKQTFVNVESDHDRIIIPLISNNEWFGFQGRALSPKQSVRYITTILNDVPPKIFNLDNVDYSKNVYITEGPFDSLLLPNSIAMVGADVDWMFLISNHETNFVFVYDNEPRNQQIIDRMSKVIDGNQLIVIWPSDIKEKDINDMVLAGRDVKQIIQDNTYSGLEAKLKLNIWKKV